MSLAVVVLAAGRGTRLKSDLPKVLHGLAGLPLIAHVLAAAVPLEPDRLVVVVGHGADGVRSFLDPRIETVDQPEQHGTGHAVLQARPSLAGQSDRVLVLFGDVPLITTESLRRLLHVQTTARAPLAILTNRAAPVAGLGRIVRNATGRLLRIVEERDADPEERAITETNSGIAVYEAAWLWSNLPRLTPSRSGEIYLTDLVALAVAQGRTVASHTIADPVETLGVNTRAELAAAEAVFFDRRRAAFGAAGVTLHLPATIAIDAAVRIAAGVEIGPNCRLAGQTVVETGCTIGGHSHLENAHLTTGARVDGATIGGYRIGATGRVGPGAWLTADGPTGLGPE